MGLSGRTHSGAVESGREVCQGRNRPAYRYTERGKCVERTYIGGFPELDRAIRGTPKP